MASKLEYDLMKSKQQLQNLNIFDFAPHELNHSAFWAFVLSSLNPKNYSKDYKNAKVIAQKFMKQKELNDISLQNIQSVKVEHQISPGPGGKKHIRYDIRIEIRYKDNKKPVLLIVETKVKDTAKEEQCIKYIRSIKGETDKAGMKGVLVLLDIVGTSPLTDNQKENIAKNAKDKRIKFVALSPLDLMNVIKVIGKKREESIISNYLNWIEGNENFWEHVCKYILQEISKKTDNPNMGKVERHKGWGWQVESKKVGIEEIGFIFEKDENKVGIQCWFGETKGQVSEIFKNKEKIKENFQRLIKKDWKIQPNLYFCTSINKRHYATPIKNWRKYFNEIYREKDNEFLMYKAREMKEKFYNLKKRGVIENVNYLEREERFKKQEKLEKDIKKLKGKNATLKRGLGLSYSFKTRDIIKRSNKLNEMIEDKINEALNNLPMR